MREFILVAIGLVAAFLLVVLWIWYIIFGKSLRKMIFTMVGIIQDKDRLVDPEAEIVPNLERHASDDLRDIAAHVKHDIPLQAQHIPPQARVPQYERGELARDTSDNGWPRELSYEERHEQRAFLNANLQTETEIYEPPQDLVQRADILDVPNPIVQPPAPIDAQLPPHVEPPVVQPPQVPIDAQIPPTMPPVAPPIVQPPQVPLPTTIPPSSPQVEPPAVQPPQPLIDVQLQPNMPQVVNPVQPPQAPIDVQMPPGEPPVAQPPQAPGQPNVPYVNTSEEDLRSSSLPPGRMTRDKRYNRNETD